MNPEVLDFRAASELLAPVRRLAPPAFRNLRVTTELHGRDVSTVGGFLVFAGIDLIAFLTKLVTISLIIALCPSLPRFR